MPSYKLYYFPARGRAELIRLLLAAAGKDYDDIRIPFDEWPKKKATFQTGQLPTFDVDGQLLCQSLTIARYLAREYGYAGKNNMEQALVDQVVETANDYLGGYFKCYFAPEDTKKEALENYLKESTPKTLTCLNKWLEQNSDGNGFFVGSSMTMADLCVYEVLTNAVLKDSKILDGFPKIVEHRKRVASLPKIKEYLEKRPASDV
ncbi:glutathione S-transferase-like isoform X3 [Mytilus californianus]|uniref:glutathione S-transferase-like isoform X3 n=1 Tax=Mytilus californianus TaxID=6549 RepID=UPI00224535C6|nr:glutathione S-transferase-like isoform X3 [Mytilus californianus]